MSRNGGETGFVACKGARAFALIGAGLKFDLKNPEHVAELYNRQDGCCAVSAVKFNLERFDDRRGDRIRRGEETSNGR
jgi:hypothetical protein